MNTEKTTRKEEISSKELLDKLLEEMMPDEIESSDEIIPPSQQLGMNYEKITTDSNEQAYRIVKSIVEYYIPKDLQKDKYIKNKIELDVLTISNLLFQMATSEHAIKCLLNEIDAGNLHPRMFEVLSGLQRSKMEIVKHLKQVEIIMENNYKTLMIEWEAKMQNQLEKGVIEEAEYKLIEKEGYSAVGTKALLKDIIKDETE